MVDHAQRFGSVTEVMYQCDECYMGGGSAICRNGQWDFEADCECEKSFLEITYSNNYSKRPQPKILKRRMQFSQMQTTHLLTVWATSNFKRHRYFSLTLM